MSMTDEHHNAISVFEKYEIAFLSNNTVPLPKKHPHAHLQGPNDAYTDVFDI